MLETLNGNVKINKWTESEVNLIQLDFCDIEMIVVKSILKTVGYSTNKNQILRLTSATQKHLSVIPYQTDTTKETISHSSLWYCANRPSY